MSTEYHRRITFPRII